MWQNGAWNLVADCAICMSIRADRGTAMRDFRVLIVDDNKDAADSMAAFLEFHGFDVQVVYSGPTAITTALADPPDAVLCDIGMPGLDGYAVASRLSAELPRRPLLVAITARPEQQVIVRGAPAGFDYYFLKPAEPVEVGALLSDYAVQRPHVVSAQLR
jgi:CheY-like chemotaxis protein